MEAWLPHNLTSFIAVVVLLSVVVLQLSVDFKDLIANQKLVGRLLQKARRAYRPKFSVIIDADQAYPVVINCLEALQKVGYKNLQIIVIVKSPAKKSTYNRLSYYRRRQNLKNIKLIRNQRGLNLNFIIKKYATGQLILRLPLNNRLAPDFFDKVGLAFLDTALASATCAKLPLANTSLASGLQAGLILISCHFQKLFRPRLEDEFLPYGVVARRKNLLQKAALKSFKNTYVGSARIYQSSAQTLGNLIGHYRRLNFKNFWRPVHILVNITWLGLATGLIYLLYLLALQQDIFLIAGMVIGVFGLFSGLMLASFKGYSVIFRFNIWLLLPFAIMFRASLVLQELIDMVFKVISLKNKLLTYPK